MYIGLFDKIRGIYNIMNRSCFEKKKFNFGNFGDGDDWALLHVYRYNNNIKY